MFMKNLLRLLLLTWAISGCSTEEPIAPVEPELTSYNQEIVSYFKEVALGFEFGNASKITRKCKKNDMKIFVGGTPTAALKSELSKIVSEINTLAKDGFEVKVVTDSAASNFYVYFGSGDEYATIFPSQKSNVESNWGLFSVFWNNNNNITGGYMYVDIFRPDATAQRHLLREELTQSLGLARDSPRYPDSIFQQSWTTTTSYAKVDKELIRLLYHPRVSSGFTATQTETTLTVILLEEQTKI
jgi:hypothetical protein